MRGKEVLMIAIKMGNIPKELTKHKNAKSKDFKPTFDNLSTEAKEELKESLLKEQGYICAYCMKKINENAMSIEHFLSKSRYNGTIENHKDFSLDYKNLLAVCENHNIHCDKFRSNCTEKLGNKTVQKEFLHLPNPKEFHKHNIRFDYSKNNFRISCNDKNIEQDIETLLNLNCQTLTINRENAWLIVKKQLQKKNKQETDWANSEPVIREAKRIYLLHQHNTTKNEPYCGFICSMLEKVFKNNLHS